MDLSLVLLRFLLTLSSIISALALVTYIEYRIIALVIPLTILYGLLLKIFERANISLKRLCSVAKSPLYAQVSESLHGMSTIRAYHSKSVFGTRMSILSDQANTPALLSLVSKIWIQIVLEILSSFLILFIGVVGVLLGSEASFVGIALTYSLAICRYLYYLVLYLSTLETEFNSVERLHYYCTALPKEAEYTRETDPKLEEWPTKGEIQFKDIQLSYPSNPDKLVLKNISLCVHSGEKIGIVGRTGSGKSTILAALFRMMEVHSGEIWIDQQNIMNLGLHTLRSRIQIIPQDPVLFTGSIRSNLDIDGLFSDDDIWESLQLVGLKEYVQTLPQALEDTITENGQNMSLGQRQLLCLARALLLKPVILVMDEATASVDTESDTLIQKAIKEQFQNSTVLSVAHRLNTIAEYDRVLVLDDGVIVEFDSPKTLLEQKGIFYSLVQATGDVNARLISNLANGKERTQE
jgi:ABC-type multidrug transport system fused ATPase/permease subunit